MPLAHPVSASPTSNFGRTRHRHRLRSRQTAFHPYPLKLLVVIDTPGHTTERSAAQAATILERLGRAAVVFRVEEGRERAEMEGAGRGGGWVSRDTGDHGSWAVDGEAVRTVNAVLGGS